MDFGAVLFSFHFPEQTATAALEGQPFELTAFFDAYSGDFLVTMRTNEFRDFRFLRRGYSEHDASLPA
jgi:hypothetical protein